MRRQRCLLLVLGAALGPPSAAAARPRLRRGDICRVRSAGVGAEGSTVTSMHVLVMDGNRRGVAFTDKSVETEVLCAGPSSDCAEWPADRAPVADISECPPCECSQDLSAGLLSPANDQLYRLAVAPACHFAAKDHPVDVLLFGLGGGAVHNYAIHRCPEGTRVQSVEADRRMAAVASKYFGITVADGKSVIDTQDALAAAASLAQRLESKRTTGSASVAHGLGDRPWDVVVVDCFVDKGITPENCRSKDFVTYLHRLVRRGGTVAHHMWHTSPYEASVAPDFASTLQLYRSIFGEKSVAVQAVPRDESIAWDSIILVKA